MHTIPKYFFLGPTNHKKADRLEILLPVTKKTKKLLNNSCYIDYIENQITDFAEHYSQVNKIFLEGCKIFTTKRNTFLPAVTWIIYIRDAHR